MIPMHYLLPEDVELIKRTVNRIQPGPHVVIDLGAGDGGTALTVLSHRSDLVVLSVDIDRIALERVESKIRAAGYYNRWHYTLSRSDKVELTLTEFDIGMLMCDATHDYASQQDELNHWLPRLMIGTPVWIHEYAGYANISYPGVKIAVDEFIAQGQLKTIEVYGLGWSGTSG